MVRVTPFISMGARVQTLLCKNRHPYLVLLQELELDRHVAAHLLVLLAVDLELQLGLLYLGQGGGVARAQVQLLQVCAVRVILNPGGMGGAQESRQK